MDSKEALASLQLLVAVAKANGVIDSEERSAIQDALADSKLPGEYTIDSLLAEDMPLESILAVLQSPEARKESFSAAYLLAYADGDCSPEEKSLLDTLQQRWSVPEAELTEIRNLVKISQGTMASGTGESSQEARTEDCQDIIKKYRIVAGLTGAVPIPVVSDIMVLTVQMSMVSDIGKVYGRKLDKTSIKALLGTLGLGTGARMAVSSLAKFIPGVGSIVGAAIGGTGSFVTTHALGQVAIKYFESGGSLSVDAMKSLFKEQKAEGEKEYQASKGKLDANKAVSDKLAELGKQLKAGSITQEQYNEEIAKVQVQA